MMKSPQVYILPANCMPPANENAIGIFVSTVKRNKLSALLDNIFKVGPAIFGL
jgi:hypothetical protein